MTFPSEDEWAEIDKRARTVYWLRVQAVRLALFLMGMTLLFALLYFYASHASPRRYDVWGNACEAWLRERHGNGE